ncbi:MAG: DUF2807 domain-containing protein [Sphingobium sp.]
MSGVQAATAAPPPARQSYSISDFDTIRLEAPVEVSIVTGKGVSATGTGDRDTLDALSLEINSRTLVIRMRNRMAMGGSGGKARLPTRIALTTGAVQRATLLGAGNLSIDSLKGARVNATLSGAGRLTVARVEADRLDVGQAGSGTLTLAGSTLELVASMSGSGRLDAAALDARRVRIDTEGSIDAQLAAREEATATANGTGQIAIAGKPTCTVRKTGSASITCGAMTY